jgi:hypothetical protein
MSRESKGPEAHSANQPAEWARGSCGSGFMWLGVHVARGSCGSGFMWLGTECDLRFLFGGFPGLRGTKRGREFACHGSVVSPCDFVANFPIELLQFLLGTRIVRYQSFSQNLQRVLLLT